MPDAKTHTGGCHCGKVHYEATVDLARVMECNCSICSKQGTLLTFAPEAAFKLLSGESGPTDYRKHNIHHMFCRTSGIKSFARGTAPDGNKMVAVNVRCLDNVDLDAIHSKQFDGKKL